MKFAELKFQPHPSFPEDGVHAVCFFDNGYGVSVVRFPGSYGFAEDLYEVAIIKGTQEDWEICYDTFIADGIIGHCDQIDIDNIIEEVMTL